MQSMNVLFKPRDYFFTSNKGYAQDYAPITQLALEMFCYLFSFVFSDRIDYHVCELSRVCKSFQYSLNELWLDERKKKGYDFSTLIESQNIPNSAVFNHKILFFHNHKLIDYFPSLLQVLYPLPKDNLKDIKQTIPRQVKQLFSFNQDYEILRLFFNAILSPSNFGHTQWALRLKQLQDLLEKKAQQNSSHNGAQMLVQTLISIYVEKKIFIKESLKPENYINKALHSGVPPRLIEQVFLPILESRDPQPAFSLLKAVATACATRKCYKLLEKGLKNDVFTVFSFKDSSFPYLIYRKSLGYYGNYKARGTAYAYSQLEDPLKEAYLHIKKAIAAYEGQAPAEVFAYASEMATDLGEIEEAYLHIKNTIAAYEGQVPAKVFVYAYTLASELEKIEEAYFYIQKAIPCYEGQAPAEVFGHAYTFTIKLGKREEAYQYYKQYLCLDNAAIGNDSYLKIGRDLAKAIGGDIELYNFFYEVGNTHLSKGTILPENFLILHAFYAGKVKKFDEAFKIYKKIFDENEGPPSSPLSASEVLVRGNRLIRAARSAVRCEQLLKAKDWCMKGLALNPENVDGYILLAFYIAHPLKDKEAKKQALEDGTRIRGKNQWIEELITECTRCYTQDCDPEVRDLLFNQALIRCSTLIKIEVLQKVDDCFTAFIALNVAQLKKPAIGRIFFIKRLLGKNEEADALAKYLAVNN